LPQTTRLAKTKVRMALDPFKVVEEALTRIKKPLPTKKITSISYDEEADVLYVKFKQSRIVDNKPLDEEGLTLASLDEKGDVVGLIIMETSKLARDVAKTR